ncbi:glycosyl transferase [Gluconobacter roseus NBRC 3990]|uniref:Glycosyl transferase n=1 Tax=Gluconobacter roseus NBRC 3990 TaxID=1307950 RepID=A0A4Y3M5B3_9PROT|nr:glycosyl transferase [Gluconobacter roseus NBRC 3990]GLP92370.1 glycosyl transferase [Gluconobacter roseus NBRC 3990]
MSLPEPSRVIVGIATSGRPTVLAELVRQLANQSVQPHRFIISYAKPDDISAIPQTLRDSLKIEFVTGHMGLTTQRNVILDHMSDEDILLFFDDDFFPHPTYIAKIIECFWNNPDVLGATGSLLADGAKGPGLEIEDANRLNETAHIMAISPVEDVFNTYGCNMAFRCDAIKRLGARFDENLPLYSWYEDMDFSRSLLPYGRIVQVNGARGVHLGNKTGKGSGIRLGYSQIINCIYLARKGTYPWSHALKSAGRHFLINAVKSLKPEPYVDRRGRLRGNLIGIGDLLRNRITPERAATITISKVAS